MLQSGHTCHCHKLHDYVTMNIIKGSKTNNIL